MYDVGTTFCNTWLWGPATDDTEFDLGIVSFMMSTMLIMWIALGIIQLMLLAIMWLAADICSERRTPKQTACFWVSRTTMQVTKPWPACACAPATTTWRRLEERPARRPALTCA